MNVGDAAPLTLKKRIVAGNPTKAMTLHALCIQNTENPHRTRRTKAMMERRARDLSGTINKGSPNQLGRATKKILCLARIHSWKTRHKSKQRVQVLQPEVDP